MDSYALKNYRNPHWEKGDWAFFCGLLDFPLERHPKKEFLALLMAGAALQMDDVYFSERLMAKAQTLVDESLLGHFSFTVLQIQLARAEFIAGYPEKALVKLQVSWQAFGALTTPLFYGFLLEQAEAQLQAGDAHAAIQTLQDIAAVMQQDTPEEIYHRMSDGYTANDLGFGGTAEQNHTWGDFHKHDLLGLFHQYLRPNFYFEIGVDQGLSLARAKGRALGVDARPVLDLQIDLPDSAHIFGMSSDAFFRDKAEQFLEHDAPDLAFIDGMHLFEFALRDFINLEKYAAPYALIGIDDVFPCDSIQAERRRQSNSWTGDVWKLIPILQTYRPDLTLLMLPCSTTGLLLIAGLDKTNRVLQDHYDEIMAKFLRDIPVPSAILQRTDTVASDNPIVSLLLSSLYRAKIQGADVSQVRDALKHIQSMIELAMEYPVISDYTKVLHSMEAKQRASRSTLMLYWRTADSGYSENNTVNCDYGLNGEPISLDLRLPSLEFTLEGLRVDIASQQGCFFVQELTVIDALGETLWSWDLDMEQVKNSDQLQSFAMHEQNKICLISTGTDPQFELDLAPDIFKKANGGSVIIKFTALDYKVS